MRNPPTTGDSCIITGGALQGAYCDVLGALASGQLFSVVITIGEAKVQGSHQTLPAKYLYKLNEPQRGGTAGVAPRPTKAKPRRPNVSFAVET
eukprot:1925140-Prymnesium_polylepis.1